MSDKAYVKPAALFLKAIAITPVLFYGIVGSVLL